MTFDVIEAIEACYGPVGDDRAWFAGLAAALAPLRDGRLAPRTIHQLRLLSAHLTIALRLRDRVSGADVARGGVGAILEPATRLRHAAAGADEPAARERLAEAVRRVERARGTLRRASPEEAAGLWSGLADGRWSLLDSCETGGRRLILARRNAPVLEDPRALTGRERDVLRHAALGHPNKLVASRLGLAPSTVATHLAAARRKLGLRTRRDLIALGTALGTPGGGPVPGPPPHRTAGG